MLNWGGVISFLIQKKIVTEKDSDFIVSVRNI